MRYNEKMLKNYKVSLDCYNEEHFWALTIYKANIVKTLDCFVKHLLLNVENLSLLANQFPLLFCMVLNFTSVAKVFDFCVEGDTRGSTLGLVGDYQQVGIDDICHKDGN